MLLVALVYVRLQCLPCTCCGSAAFCDRVHSDPYYHACVCGVTVCSAWVCDGAHRSTAAGIQHVVMAPLFAGVHIVCTRSNRSGALASFACHLVNMSWLNACVDG
jgi:hypothetical protein